MRLSLGSFDPDEAEPVIHVAVKLFLAVKDREDGLHIFISSRS